MTSSLKKDPQTDGYFSYVEDAYARFFESAGARLAPIIYGDETQDLDWLLQRVNGLILPGGIDKQAHRDWEKTVIEKVLARNDEGHYMPILGIGLGMQKLTWYFDSRSNSRVTRSVKQTSLPLVEGPHSVDTDIYKVSERVNHEHFINEAVFFHQHTYGIDPSTYENDNLKDVFDVVAINTDSDGNEFATVIEGKNYPMWGLQFNPEKATSSMSKFNAFPHSPLAIQLNRFFADYFVFKTKMSDQAFCCYSQEVENLVGNGHHVETTTYYGGVYLFPEVPAA